MGSTAASKRADCIGFMGSLIVKIMVRIKVQAAFECCFRIPKSSLHLTGCLKAKLQQSSRSGIYARYFSNLPVFVGHKCPTYC